MRASNTYNSCDSCGELQESGSIIKHPTCPTCKSQRFFKWMKESKISPMRPICQKCNKAGGKQGKQVKIGSYEAKMEQPWVWLTKANI